MRYSRTRINQVGKILASNDFDIIKIAEATTIVEHWREDHAKPMQELAKQVLTLLQREGIKISFSSQRLKRMASIKDKIQRNPQMELGRVQDIGGIRFVFEDVDNLKKAQNAVKSATFEDFSFVKENDYVSEPKESGYRSIHLVYKYNSNIEEYNGLMVELQIRTRIQHDWATAVETAELVSKSPLKSSLGDENWLNFFKLVSAVFAKKENLPVSETFVNYNLQRYCKEYSELEGKYKFMEQLRALMGIVDYTQKDNFVGGYVMLLIMYGSHKVTVHHFKDEQLSEANEIYSKLEEGIKREEGSVVLVSVEDMNNLRDAYPSYFLNAQEFIATLHDFTQMCKREGWE